MKKHVRMLSAMVLTLIVLFSFSVTAFAASAGSLTVTADKETVKAGDTINFTITVANGEEGVSGLEADVAASANLTFKSSAFDGVMGKANDHRIALARTSSDGEGKDLVITYTYTVNDDVKDGDKVSFTLNNAKACGTALDENQNVSYFEMASTAAAEATVQTSVVPPVTVDKSALNEAIAAAKSLKEADYTADTWKALQTAVADAEKVAADANATQAQVDAATQAVRSAITGLKKAASTQEPEKDPNKDDVPKTGDETSVLPLVILMAVSAVVAAVVVLKKKVRA